MDNKAELFAGYIPVLHDGYIRAFDRHPDATIGVFDTDILKDFSHIRKDIRALNPLDSVRAIQGLGRNAIKISAGELETRLQSPIIMPDDDISRILSTKYPRADITLEPVFLRWDRGNTSQESEVIPDRTVHIDQSDDIMQVLEKELKRSTNWWRHIGAVVVLDGTVVASSHNSSPLPTEYTSMIESDPRITAFKGDAIERSIDIHAEAKLIAEASKSGLKLEGSSIYVTTFPCPNCAKLLALSGVKTCYYAEGYSMLDGYSILKAFDIEVVKLEVKLDDEDSRIYKPYPKN